MNYRKAIGADLNEMRKIRVASELLSVDFAEHLENFIVIEDAGEIIGLGGFDVYDDSGLVRSLVVIPKYRGKGIAKNIDRRIEDNAYHLSIKALYFLTESAVEYFQKLGFAVQQRIKAPISVMNTTQFRELCPSSVTFMFRNFKRFGYIK
ncbi:MAG: GNAT family N-acetyltransferase [Gammaproteobacteria bacterium]|nr:GNAT family N-acetyltransferase [Gammaproteobacteria bacterium]